MYDDILSGIPVAEGVIPESVENFSEAARYVIENTESDFNEMLEEMNLIDGDGNFVNESTDEVVNEGLEDVKDRAVEVLENLWGSIKAFFEKVFKWFKDKAEQAKAFLDEQVTKVKDKIEDKRQARVIKKFGDVKPEIIKADVYKKMPKVNDWSGINQIVTAFKNGATYITSGFADVADVEAKNKQLLAKLSSGDNNVTGVATLRQSIKKAAKGEKKNVTAADFKVFYSVVLKNEQMKTVKTFYNEARKTIKKCITDAKGAKKKLSGKDNKDLRQDFAKYISLMKTQNQILHAAHAAACDVLKERFNEYTRALSKIARAAARQERKDKKDKKANASTEFESLFGF